MKLYDNLYSLSRLVNYINYIITNREEFMTPLNFFLIRRLNNELRNEHVFLQTTIARVLIVGKLKLVIVIGWKILQSIIG